MRPRPHGPDLAGLRLRRHARPAACGLACRGVLAIGIVVPGKPRSVDELRRAELAVGQLRVLVDVVTPVNCVLLHLISKLVDTIVMILNLKALSAGNVRASLLQRLVVP